MATVNAQITDAVTQTNAGVVGDAPAMAIGMLYQSMAQATGIALNNASANQNNLNQLNSAIVSQAIATIAAATPKA